MEGRERRVGDEERHWGGRAAAENEAGMMRMRDNKCCGNIRSLGWGVHNEGPEILTNDPPMVRVGGLSFDCLVHVVIDGLISNLSRTQELLTKICTVCVEICDIKGASQK